jgi:hypothetical protein
VLLVENNVASGQTLAHLTAAVRAVEPARLELFCDYVLTEVAGLTAADLQGFDEVRCGPWPAADAGDLRRKLLRAVDAQQM